MCSNSLGIIKVKKPEKIDKFDRPAYKTPKPHTRVGSMAVLAAPSRIDKTLFYPDGRVKRESTT
jgi:hypothetical protein